MRILIAPDSFKGSLSAAEAAEAIARGVRSVVPDCEVRLLPLADGGEGTLEVLTRYADVERIERGVTDPLGRVIRAAYGWMAERRMAVVELAEASGLVRLRDEERNPLLTSTYGTGELLADALKRGAEEVLLGVGGSATHDGGTGLLRALGYRFRDAQGEELCGGGECLERIASIDDSESLPALRSVRFTLACDVQNPLCGAEGAAAIYAPQKGADPEMVKRLDRGLEHFARVVEHHCGISIDHLSGAGAAGGVAGVLYALLGATLHRGVEVVMRAVDFDRQLIGCDWVITGEGRLDHQTRMGKVPSGVRAAAARAGIPTLAIGGSVRSEEELLSEGFAYVKAATPEGMPLREAMQRDVALQNLYRAAAEVAKQMLGRAADRIPSNERLSPND